MWRENNGILALCAPHRPYNDEFNDIIANGNYCARATNS